MPAKMHPYIEGLMLDNLPVKACRLLIELGITTDAGLFALTWEDVRRQRGYGRGTYDEITRMQTARRMPGGVSPEARVWRLEQELARMTQTPETRIAAALESIASSLETIANAVHKGLPS